jgi:hypothetical protein
MVSEVVKPQKKFKQGKQKKERKMKEKSTSSQSTSNFEPSPRKKRAKETFWSSNDNNQRINEKKEIIYVSDDNEKDGIERNKKGK